MLYSVPLGVPDDYGSAVLGTDGLADGAICGQTILLRVRGCVFASERKWLHA